jgi:amidophosphoribosyltransferase
VGAGEVIFFDMMGNIHSRICHAQVHSPCIFEYVYFARPDSIMDGVSVYETRLKMGEKLAQKIMRLYPEHEIDVVIPIPDTSRTSALQAAYCLDRPFREGFIKNRYIARTFIMPGQATRKKSVRLKLNTIKSEFVGRNVLLVDDSIVRGTTANEIVQMARDAGAKKVFFSSAAPPIRYPNIYGIDIPTRQELIAYERDEAQIAEKIGCEWVVFQDLNDLQDCIWEVKNPQEMEEEKRCLASGMNTANAHPQTTVARLIPQFDTSCFSGTYVTGETISDFYFEQLYNKRNDVAKEQSKYGSPTKTISQMNGHSSSKSSSSHSIADADNDGSTANGDTNAVVVVDEEALLRKPIPMTRQPSYDGCESINNDRRETNDGDHGSSCESLNNHQSNYDL